MSRSYRKPVIKCGANADRKRSYRRLLRHHLDGQVNESAEAVALIHPLSMDDYDVCDWRWYAPDDPRADGQGLCGRYITYAGRAA